VSFSIIVPTLGRPSLGRLLDSLAAATGPRPECVVLVDDRPGDCQPLLTSAAPGWLNDRVIVLRSGGTGPAAARNVGWRATKSDWAAFLDDDVEVSAHWLDELRDDLAAAGPDVGASTARITVPLPPRRRPTDWERGTAGLATAQWITADMAYRRGALIDVGGFDERFPRAFREDSDLALRVIHAGYRIASGQRQTRHPVRPARWNASIAQQRGNRDDALMRKLHGSRWHERAGASRGRRSAHLLTTAVGALALAGALARRPRLALPALAAWAVSTGEFTWARIAPGPRDAREIATMALTSAAIPPVATGHWLIGLHRHRAAQPWPGADDLLPAQVDAVLIDRDGTLVLDVPYNADPSLVQPLPGVAESLRRLREAGLSLAVVTNQSGIGRGLLTAAQVDAVNARIECLLGPFADWQICPHSESDACECRKPQPAMVVAAAQALGVPLSRCVLIGDIGADLGAAAAAGTAAILVPTDATRPEEISAAPLVCASFSEATELILSRVPR
jgi:histidinol-phosphate phosphatase family protein